MEQYTLDQHPKRFREKKKMKHERYPIDTIDIKKGNMDENGN